jgi:predicted Zn-dependent protease
VLVEGAGSFSIDQQRYNGQFGGDAFWEIKNGKKTRMVTDSPQRDHPTTSWANLDAVAARDGSITWPPATPKGSRCSRIIHRRLGAVPDPKIMVGGVCVRQPGSRTADPNAGGQAG